MLNQKSSQQPQSSLEEVRGQMMQSRAARGGLDCASDLVICRTAGGKGPSQDANHTLEFQASHAR